MDKKAKKSKVRRSKKKSKIIIPDKGLLSRYGYTNVKRLSLKKRHESLRRSLRENKPLSIYRRLVALSTLTRNINPKLSKKFKKDSKFVKKTKEYKNRNTKTKTSVKKLNNNILKR